VMLEKKNEWREVKDTFDFIFRFGLLSNAISNER
jgi:hypothetical protein